MSTIHLRRSGVSVLISLGSAATPEPAQILHWGADLGPHVPDLTLLGDAVPHSALDVPVKLGIVPQASDGWRGRPGLRGHRLSGSSSLDGGSADGSGAAGFSPRLRVVESSEDGMTARIVQADSDLDLRVISTLTLHPGGLLEVSHQLANHGVGSYALTDMGVSLPVGPEGTEVLDLTGRWCRERHPQRHSLAQGTWVRSGRHGRTGHDSSLLTAVGTPGFSNRSGKVWAGHFAWSGDHEEFVDHVADGRTVLGAAELLGSGEIVLAPGERYTTPAYYAAYSENGLDGITAAFYEWFRERPQHPSSPRPVVLNVWEAVYFNHDLGVLTELADSAAELGVERFVLDDGWFRNRRNDHAGLGDWFVDEGLWPKGLTPLIDVVKSRGMQFGLWVEPEMISIDSDVAREHPEWISGPVARRDDSSRVPLEWRFQQVIDLVNPDAWQYVYDRIHALLTENTIDYLKWDQNRDLLEMGHESAPSAHAQTLAAYRLYDALKAAHPAVEIESCSSGGGRVDLGILQRTDRVWASDCNDALERVTIQRWTSAVIPPELMGSHIGPRTSHTTARTHDLSFRAITALFGHFGMEWDIRQVVGEEREELRSVIALYKQYRDLIHFGTTVNADLADPSLTLHGVVAKDSATALFALTAVSTSFSEQPGRIAIPGLDPELNYRVRLIYPALNSPAGQVQGDTVIERGQPAWMQMPDGPVASGRFLDVVGLPMPVLNPEHAILLAVDQL